MKATEVLSKYAAGERNFHGMKLRGQSFKGKNLQGADFSGADIRGTNFKDANLQGVNFTNFEYYQSLSPEAKEALLIERGATLKMVLEGGSNININNSSQQENNNTMSQITQSHSGSGDNVAGDKNLTNDNSRTQNISGGTINNSGAGAFSLGDLNGTVANTINQLPASSNPNQPGIKDLLTQLQVAIDDPNLGDDDKQETLKQLEALATAGQDPQAETMQKKAKRAVGFLQVIAEGLEPATKLAQACGKVLPKILLFFGL